MSLIIDEYVSAYCRDERVGSDLPPRVLGFLNKDKAFQRVDIMPRTSDDLKLPHTTHFAETLLYSIKSGPRQISTAEGFVSIALAISCIWMSS
jgi:hypothetical protein